MVFYIPAAGTQFWVLCLSVCSMIILTLLSNIIFSSSHLLLAFTISIFILSVLLKFIMKCKWDLWFSLWVMDPLFCSDATTTAVEKAAERELRSKSLLHPLFWCTSAWIPLGLLQSRKLSIKGQSSGGEVLLTAPKKDRFANSMLCICNLEWFEYETPMR